MHDAGLDVAEIAELLTQLEPAIDYLNLTVGMRSAYVRDMATETPPLLATTRALRGLTSRPLLISHGFRRLPEMERALAERRRPGRARAWPDRRSGAAAEVPRRPAGDRPAVRGLQRGLPRVRPDAAVQRQPVAGAAGRDRRPAAPLAFGLGAGTAEGPVAIVGAGPGGLECALALVRPGVRSPSGTRRRPSAARWRSRAPRRTAAAGGG